MQKNLLLFITSNEQNNSRIHYINKTKIVTLKTKKICVYLLQALRALSAQPLFRN
jgi:hypothetical protein